MKQGSREVMEDDNGSGACERGLPKDLPRLDAGGVERAEGQNRCSEYAMLCVEQHHAKLLDAPPAERRHQEPSRFAWRPQLKARLRPMGQRPPSDLERGH